MIQYTIVLYCIVLYCIVLYCIVLYCIVYYHGQNIQQIRALLGKKSQAAKDYRTCRVCFKVFFLLHKLQAENRLQQQVIAEKKLQDELQAKFQEMLFIADELMDHFL